MPSETKGERALEIDLDKAELSQHAQHVVVTGEIGLHVVVTGEIGLLQDVQVPRGITCRGAWLGLEGYWRPCV